MRRRPAAEAQQAALVSLQEVASSLHEKYAVSARARKRGFSSAQSFKSAGSAFACISCSFVQAA